jgi:hypothetical protein
MLSLSKFETFGDVLLIIFIVDIVFVVVPMTLLLIIFVLVLQEFHCECEAKGFKSYRAKERHYQVSQNFFLI